MTRKSKKGESRKTESLTVRLSPRVKFGLELLARKQHRTLAGVVEWAIDMGMSDPDNGIPDLDELWSPLAGERLKNLKDAHPNLLSYEEELLFARDCLCPACLKTHQEESPK
jgi:hypothetical protein